MNCPPPLGSPRFARGTARGAPTRFPLRAGGTLRKGSSTDVFVNSGSAIGIISVFALVFQHAPLPTSPVDGGGVAAPSPPAGRVGVGAMFKSHCKDTYQSHRQSLHMPPSCRFPPLREGNRARVRFPLRAGGTLRRGSSIALVFVNCVPAIGITPTQLSRGAWN